MEPFLTSDQQRALLKIASQAVKATALGQPPNRLDLSQLSPELMRKGASFVTLTNQGDLRGCIGSIEARLPLAEDVQAHAVDASSRDYRFSPISENELAQIAVEISVLTPPIPLPYQEPSQLLGKLRPGIDGLLLQYQMHRSTFLPQVWEKLPDPAQFLTALCLKARLPGDIWQREVLDIQTYQVFSFHSPTLL
ncbi:MAG: AmmeMemoRadiSam system protein A [Anaerolineales bacterium]|jgi:AmmeMemoRadiSam system protein A